MNIITERAVYRYVPSARNFQLQQPTVLPEGPSHQPRIHSNISDVWSLTLSDIWEPLGTEPSR